MKEFRGLKSDGKWGYGTVAYHSANGNVALYDSNTETTFTTTKDKFSRILPICCNEKSPLYEGDIVRLMEGTEIEGILELQDGNKVILKNKDIEREITKKSVLVKIGNIFEHEDLKKKLSK